MKWFVFAFFILQAFDFIIIFNKSDTLIKSGISESSSLVAPKITSFPDSEYF